MVRDTVAHLRAEGQRVFLDAEHFFDGYRPTATTRSRCCARRTRPAPRWSRCATPTAACCRPGSPTWSHDVVETDRRPGRHPLPQRHRLRGGQHARRGRRRARPTCRAPSTATASAPATPTWSPSSPTSSSSWAAQVLPAGPAARGHPDRPRRRRGDQRAAGLPPAVRRRLARSRTRPACTPARSRSTRTSTSTSTRPTSATTCGCWSPTWPAGPRSSSRAASSASTCPATASWSPGSPTGSRRWRRAATPSRRPTRRSSCCSLEEVEGARPSYFDVESWRVITETLAPAAGDEARLRGDGQAARRRACGSSSPARATARSTRSTRRCARRSGRPTREVAKFELIDYKVRILDQGHGTDAVTRVLIETTDGEASWVTVGVGAQRDRGVLGGAASTRSPTACAGSRPADARLASA